MKATIEDKRPLIPGSCPKLIKKLIELCWHKEPNFRPSVNEILNQLEHIHEVGDCTLQTINDSNALGNTISYIPEGNKLWK